MQEWQRQKGSKGKVFGLLVCRPSAWAVTSWGLHPGQFAARGRAGQVAPVAARFARAHREASARARGLHPRQFAARGRAGQVAPVAARFARAHREASARARRSASAVTSRLGQLASLVLIERPAHVRGGVPPLSLRACGSSLRSCSSRGQRTSAAECLRCHFAPWAARCRSCSSNRQRTCAPGVVCCPAAPGLCDGKSALCVSIPQKGKRPAAVAAGLSFYPEAPGRYSISQQSSHTPS